MNYAKNRPKLFSYVFYSTTLRLSRFFVLFYSIIIAVIADTCLNLAIEKLIGKKR